MIKYDMDKHENEWQKNPIDTKYYIAFVLGYDLLWETLNGGYTLECDTCFEICLRLADEFMASEEYKDMSMSTYDALQEWIREWSMEIDATICEMR